MMSVKVLPLLVGSLAVVSCFTPGATLLASSARAKVLASTTMSADATFDWSGFEQYLIPGLARPLLLAKGAKGYAACGYIDVATADKLEEACIIFTGVNTCDDFLNSDVKKVSAKAEALGCFVGQSGSAAMEMLR